MGRRPTERVVYSTRPAKSTEPRLRLLGSGYVAGTAVGGTLASRLLRYGSTAALLALTTAALWPFRDTAGLLNVGLTYLVAVIAVTVLAGRIPGIFASLLGFALFDYFFVPPYLTFAIEGIHNILALAVFLGVSLLISWLIASAREEARQAHLRAEDISRLYELNQAVIGSRRAEEILPAVAQKVCAVFEAEVCWILLPRRTPDSRATAHGTPAENEQPGGQAWRGELSVVAQAPDTARSLTRNEMSLAVWAFEHGERVVSGGERRSADSEQSGHVAFVPLRASQSTTGVLAVARKKSGRAFTAAEQTVLVTFAGQTAVALERLRLLGEAERAELLARTDELKSALMSAVSHDLRTPLASITASVTSLLDPDIEWDAETKRDFLQGIYDEAQHLNTLVGNLLDMSRIEGGALHPEKNWYSIGEVIEAVVQRLEPHLAEHTLTVDVAEGMPLVLLDFTEIAQVLTNLIENAIKYAGPGSAIHVQARQVGNNVEVSVLDEGRGVPPEALPRLFDKFYRVDKWSESAGTGLGLAIVKGLVAAHGGTISASNRLGGGLKVTFTLPIGRSSEDSAGGTASSGRAEEFEDKVGA